MAAGAILPGFFFFSYLAIRTRERLHRAVTAITGIGFIFSLGELLVVYIGGSLHDFGAAVQIYRLQQVAATWLIVVLPVFLDALLSFQKLSKRINRGVVIGGLGFCVASTIIAFVVPDWFRSVTTPNLAAGIYESSYGRGASGWLYTVRDAVLAAVFVYVGVQVVKYLFAAGRKRYLFIILTGILLSLLFGAGDVVSNLAGRSVGPFAAFTYPRAVVGVSLFLFFAMLSTVTRYVDIAQEVDATHRRLRESEKELSYMAYFDSLTGVRNRKSFYEETSRGLNLHDRTGETREVAVLYVDLDRFKEINDSYGHHVGDVVLQEVARRFKDNLRQSDDIYRLGGDEFLVYLPSLKDPADAGLVAQKLIDALSEVITVGVLTFYVGTCVGIAVYPDDGENVEALVQAADRALYEAKKQRNTYKFFDAAMQQTSIRNVRIISGLRRAVADDQLSLRFQPIFDADGRLSSAEALLRWIDPEWGAIPPSTFIPLAEGSGLIGEIGRWVIEEAVDTFKEIEGAGASVHMAVNLSTKQLLHPSFIEEVLDLFADRAVNPSCFCLEITENSLFEDTATAIARLRDAGQQGLNFAIDDFGRGYSALAYLKELPVDIVKIDKSFVHGLPHNERDVSVVEGVLTIARGMGFRVIAEGIESPAQQAFLADRGCHLFQGFGLSRPLTRDAFVELAKRQARRA